MTKPLEIPRHMWVHNIKMNLGETGWGGMDWIDLVQDREQWRVLEPIKRGHEMLGSF
jgi:hypothetical protein